MDRWRGRTALVTGASAGIGRAIAVRLLTHGLNVVACARRVDAVESIREEAAQAGAGVGELLAVKCDVGKEEEILAMFAQIKASKLGGVDVCVNNAALMDVSPLREGQTSTWRDLLAVNVLGPALCARETLRSMKERGVDDGHIVNMSGNCGHYVYPTQAMYCATKHAVQALSEGLRQELLAEKSVVRVSVLSPGFTRTAIFDSMLDKADVQALLGKLDGDRKILDPEDVSAMLEHVLSAPPHVQVTEVMMNPLYRK